MDAVPDGGVLGGKTEGIEAIGVEHVKAAHTLVAGVDIRRYIVIPVADMKVAGGIGEHGKGVPLGARVVVPDFIKLIFSPAVLPLFLNLPGKILVYHVYLLWLIQDSLEVILAIMDTYVNGAT
jgi:hypothetical protein